MESLDTSTTLSENPIKSANPSSLWVNDTSKYLYQNHQLSSKLTASHDRFTKFKESHRSRSIDMDATRSPQSSSRSIQLSVHATIALSFLKKELSAFPITALNHVQTLLILDLSSNSFTEFPEEVLRFTKLKSLKLESNKLRKIPKEIYQLSHLETLSFASNYITEIPSTIALLHETMNVLNISKNRLESIPEELTQLTNLKVLHIQNNSFMSLPVQLQNLSSLRELGLEWFKYTYPSLPPVQNDKNRGSILKLFELCTKFTVSQKRDVYFEDFVNYFSPVEQDLIAMKDHLQRNILHISALEEEIGIVKYLAKYRQDLLNESDQNNQTPLSLAIREEKDRSAKILITNGANPNVGIGSLGSALHIATARHRVGLVKDLLKFDANPNEADIEGNTPLHVICSIFSKKSLASVEIAGMLMSAGADPNFLNRDGWSPLHLAIRRGQTECIQWATEFNRKNEGSIRRCFDFNIKGGSDKWTLLHLAAGLGFYDILNSLTDNHVDLMAKTKTGKTARDVAVNNIIISKVLKKLEDQWIMKNLFRAETLDNKIKEFSAGSNVYQLKSMIHGSSARVMAADVVVEKAPEEKTAPSFTEENEKKLPSRQMTKLRYLKGNSRTKESARPLRAHLKLDDLGEDNKKEESSIFIGDVDEVVEGKELTRVMPRSPNNIQKIQIAQNYREHMIRSSVSKETGWSGVTELDQSKNKLHRSGTMSLGSTLSSCKSTSRPNPQNFIFPHDFNKYIKNFESYVEEIKRFQDLLLKESEVSLSDKLKHLFYMQVLHMKITGKLHKINSEKIPVELFILCEHIEDERKKNKDKVGAIKHNYDIIPRTLLFIFENLDSRKSLKNCFVKTRISHLFGDFKYDSCKHFLSLLVSNHNERIWLRAGAQLALGQISKALHLNLNFENLAKESHLATVLVSPKVDTYHYHKESLQTTTKTLQTQPGKPHKRTQSDIPATKCENIDEDDDIHGFKNNSLRVSLEKNSLEKKGGASYLRTGIHAKMVQEPIPSKNEPKFIMNRTSSTVHVTLDEYDAKILGVRETPRKTGFGSFFNRR